ncbi:MAG: M48 family peptidase, partial [Candidatus Marinimicrobia bacterium]|nr:M48 family peptidase [Candidatus Neomarinimicrobiota bacterium]
MSDDQLTSLKTNTGKRYQRLKLLLSITEFILGLAILSAFLGFGLSQKLEGLIRLSFRNDYLVLILFVTSLGLFEGILLFPLSLYSGFVIEHRYNLSDQRLSSWLREQLKAVLVSYPIILVLITIFYTLLCRYPLTWWIWMGTAMVLFSIIIARLAPILLFPIFYKFVPLEDKSLTEKVSNLCKQVGLNLKGVYQFNLSKTT